MGKKIAVVLTDMFEDVEYTDPAQALEDAGHELTVIENEKGNTVTVKMVMPRLRWMHRLMM